MSIVLVDLRFDPKRIPSETLSKLKKELPKIVAGAMSCSTGGSDALVLPSGVQVNFLAAPAEKNVNTFPIQAKIFANDRDERRENLRDRRKLIGAGIESLLPAGIKGSVVTMLVPLSYGEFKSEAA